jgi:hypothetical protein
MVTLVNFNLHKKLNLNLSKDAEVRFTHRKLIKARLSYQVLSKSVVGAKSFGCKWLSSCLTL